jgi:hypothetical protein
VGELGVRLPDLRLCAPPVVDVGEQRVPAGDLPECVAKRTVMDLKPTINAIKTPDARLETVRLP